ncbi:MAG: hypothetical protein ABSG77_11480 [Candidatus Acidiferrum sp.]|jgi:hypothetical protein
MQELILVHVRANLVFGSTLITLREAAVILQAVERLKPMTQTVLGNIGWRKARTLSAKCLKVNLEIHSARSGKAVLSPASLSGGFLDETLFRVFTPIIKS